MVKGVCRGFTESPALDHRNAASFLSGARDSGAWQTRRQPFGRLRRVPASLHCGCWLRFQKNPETEPVRDQQ